MLEVGKIEGTCGVAWLEATVYRNLTLFHVKPRASRFITSAYRRVCPFQADPRVAAMVFLALGLLSRRRDWWNVFNYAEGGSAWVLYRYMISTGLLEGLRTRTGRESAEGTNLDPVMYV